MVAPVSDEPGALLPHRAATRGWRLLDRAAVAVAIAALLVPATLFAIGRRPAPIENRPLLTPPPASASRIFDTSFYAAIDAYLADNVALRPTAVRLRSTLDAGILRGNVDPDVIRGRGDWLFSRVELVPACIVTAKESAAAFDRIAGAFAAAGQHFHVLVAPDKHAIYPERLDPDAGLATPCTDDRRAAMRAWMAEHPELAVDGWTPVLEARAKESGPPGLYYAEDSHWTPAGALPAIENLVTALDSSLWDPADVVQDGTLRFPQELAQEQGFQRTQRVPRYRIRPDVTVDRTTIPVSVPLTNAADIYRYVPQPSRHPTLPGRTAIVYDSFFGILQPLVTPFFAESVWIHASDLQNQPALAAELGRFDRVIYERAERGLYLSHVDDVLGPLVSAGG